MQPHLETTSNFSSISQTCFSHEEDLGRAHLSDVHFSRADALAHPRRAMRPASPIFNSPGSSRSMRSASPILSSRGSSTGGSEHATGGGSPLGRRRVFMANLKSQGVTAKELRLEGHSLDDLRDHQYSVKELLNAGWELDELKEGNVTKGLKNAGFNLAYLKQAGYTLKDFKTAGYTASELRAASTVSPPPGDGATSSRDSHSARRALDREPLGFSVTNLKQAGYLLYELRVRALRLPSHTCISTKLPSILPAPSAHSTRGQDPDA